MDRPEGSSTWRETFASIDPAWEHRGTWMALRQASGPVSAFFLLQAVDLRRGADGGVVAAPEEVRIYLRVLGRTFAVAAAVTLVALLLGFPVAYFLANAPARLAYSRSLKNSAAASQSTVSSMGLPSFS